MPEEYFGKYDIYNKVLNSSYGYSFNIMNKIADILLNCNPIFFHKKPTENEVNKNNERITKEFCGALYFKQLYEDVLKGEENLTSSGLLKVPLCIGITLDETTTNKTLNKNVTPVCF